MSDGPLAGCGVLITRPAHQSRELAAAIGAAGGKVVRFPVLEIVGRDVADIRNDLAGLATPDIVVFISSNAVTHGFAALRESNAQLAAVGPTTRDALEALGATVNITPVGAFDSEHLLQHAALQNPGGRNVLIVRGQSGRELLAETLTARGANVDYLCAYRREPYPHTAAEIDSLESRLREGAVQYVTIMSVESMQQLLRILPSRCLPLLRQSALVAPSARVLRKASELLPGVSTVLAADPQAAAIVAALIRQWRNGQN